VPAADCAFSQAVGKCTLPHFFLTHFFLAIVDGPWALGQVKPWQVPRRKRRLCAGGPGRHHPPWDPGAQYSSKASSSSCVRRHGGKGMPYDNAGMESFFSSLKQQITHHERFDNRGQARARIFDYMEVFYNRQRPHSGLDSRSPADFEKMAVLFN